MGRKDSELAKGLSSLILSDDDLARMVDAIAMGRKIYTNLKKAIQYIIWRVVRQWCGLRAPRPGRDTGGGVGQGQERR